MSEILLEFENVPYTQIANQVLWDKRLSLRAVGLFALLRAYGDLAKRGKKKKKLSLDELASDHVDGRASVQAGVKELKRFGYLKIETVRKLGKFIGYKWTITTGNNDKNPESAQLTPKVDNRPTAFLRTNPPHRKSKNRLRKIDLYKRKRK